MNATRRDYVRSRRKAWAEFDALTTRMSRPGWTRPSAPEITRFSKLLREIAGDLALLRGQTWGRELERHLNQLLTRGHNVLYTRQPGGAGQFLNFVTVGYPRLVRRYGGYMFVALLLFAVPLGMTWAVVQTEPELASRLLPVEMLDQFETMYSESSDEAGSLDEGRTAMAGFYVWNNVGIALACFARGALLGVGTAFTLLYNGLVIGAISGYVIQAGYGDRFLSFVVSHGSFELTAIVISGAAGLALGDSLVHPGNHTRRDALLVRSRDAVKIAAGAGLMLMVAALIEAFWSPAPIPASLKILVGGALWLAVILYLGLAGLRRSDV